MPQPRSLGQLAAIGLGIVTVTFVLAAVVGYAAYQWALSQHWIDDFQRPSTSDLVGVWRIDPDDRPSDQVPVFKQVNIYPTRLDYMAGNGTVSLEGKWRESGFWIPRVDDEGEIQVAKLTGPETIEVHESAFPPLRSSEVALLYKERGTDAEMKELAAKYPPPHPWPPPAGVIKAGMTEYELKQLPWKADSLERVEVEGYDSSMVFVYHSDNPRLDPLRVTVKNHRVVLVQGGNG